MGHHILEGLTYKMVPVNPPKKLSLGSRNIEQHIYIHNNIDLNIRIQYILLFFESIPIHYGSIDRLFFQHLFTGAHGGGVRCR